MESSLPSMPDPANPLGPSGAWKGRPTASPDSTLPSGPALQDGVLQKMVGHNHHHERLKDLTSRVLNGDQDKLPKLCPSPDTPLLKGADALPTVASLQRKAPSSHADPSLKCQMTQLAGEVVLSGSEEVKRRKGRVLKTKPPVKFSPLINTTCPLDTTSSLVTTTSPMDTTTRPFDTTTSPLDTNSPLDNTSTAMVGGLDTTASPLDTTTSPLDTTSPRDTTACPLDTTTSSFNTTTSPLDTSTSPLDTTSTTSPLDTTSTTSPLDTTSTTSPLDTTTTTSSLDTTTSPLTTSPSVACSQVGALLIP
ncbi:hypothetical protein NHX12_019248 [Muraenolepis orangiensis]|uniref:Uncharacterized protein n=1 Tax=Muraenolepis orangiensis TaxID=630683 RepID=A0A9Q0EWE8_9TELE|nr:hypothetical protein NHX12_019248 [Muraenolepis orangiensis]